MYQLVDNGEMIVDGCAKGVEQMKCRCNLAEINCVPEDNLEVVMQCDATLAQVDSDCTYSKTTGSTFSQSLSTSMSLDYTVKAKLTVEFFELFSEGIAVSSSTGYDWTSVSSETINVEETVTIKTQAKAGLVTRIEQAVGHCGGSTAKTELFRISDIDRHGKIVQQDYVKMFNNGSSITLPSEMFDNARLNRPINPKLLSKESKKFNEKIPVSVPVQN